MSEPSWIEGAAWLEMARDLRNDRWQLADLCGLDARDLGFEHRFEAVIQLVNYETKERRTVHVRATGEPPTVPSVAEIWPTANFMEREAYDLFGINFEGHPNLTRILMPDEWEGHPLRKDYGVGKVTIEFIPQPFLQVDAPAQSPDSEDSRVEVDSLGQVKQDRGGPS